MDSGGFRAQRTVWKSSRRQLSFCVGERSTQSSRGCIGAVSGGVQLGDERQDLPTRWAVEPAFAGIVCLLRPRFHGRAGTLMKQLRCRWLNDRLRLLLKVRSMHGRARKVRAALCGSPGGSHFLELAGAR